MKRKIKVFALPSHQEKERTHGVDFARIIQPVKHLNGYTDDEVEIETTLFDIRKKTDWLYVAQNYDVIYLNYINNPWGFAAMGAMARKHGVKMIMDIDDDIWDLHEDNPAYDVYKKGSEALQNFTAICNEVDYITCTSNYLRNVVLANTKKKANQVYVFPNYVDLKLYKHRTKFKDTGRICITHFGSTTHFNDLLTPAFVKGMDRIMKEYPNVIFRSIGAFLPQFRNMWGARYENPFGHQDIYHWIKDKDKFPKFMDETDFLVVPLVEDIYNKCKSSIKWIEASSAKVPGVWQDIRQYQEVIDGENGLLAKSDGDWYKCIKKMIDDKEFRKRAGKKTFEDVKNGWTIQAHVKDYADFIKSIL